MNETPRTPEERDRVLDETMRETPLTVEERDRVLDEIVERIHRYRLEMPALFFLEIHRPLAGLAGMASFMVTPLFGAFFGLDKVERYASLISDRDALDALTARLDAARDADAPPGGNPELGTRN